MPPASQAVESAVDVPVHGQRLRQETLYAALHLCPNRSCTGAVVAHYHFSSPGGGYRYRFRAPQWREYKVSDSVPERPRAMLRSANDARRAPVACAAAAVKAFEAMMAEVGYRERKLGLRKRIDKAVEDGKLSKLMGDLAHDVREIGNEMHTDDDPEPITSQTEADRALKFANLLANYLFELPVQIAQARGRRRG